jgi:peptide chain release factor subunit 1
VAEAANEVFSGIPDLKGVLLGGPGPMKDEFLKSELLPPNIKDRIIGIFDTGYTDEQGVKEVVNKAGEVLADLEILKEKAAMQEFLEELVAGRGLVAYGEDEIKKALEQGAVKTLLISEDLRKNRATITCEGCGGEFKETVEDVGLYERQILNRACPKCGERRLRISESVDVVQDLLDLADRFNTKSQFISIETEEGKQLQMAFKGLAAVLRFRGAA